MHRIDVYNYICKLKNTCVPYINICSPYFFFFFYHYDRIYLYGLYMGRKHVYMTVEMSSEYPSRGVYPENFYILLNIIYTSIQDINRVNYLFCPLKNIVKQHVITRKHPQS